MPKRIYYMVIKRRNFWLVLAYFIIAILIVSGFVLREGEIQRIRQEADRSFLENCAQNNSVRNSMRELLRQIGGRVSPDVQHVFEEFSNSPKHFKIRDCVMELRERVNDDH